MEVFSRNFPFAKERKLLAYGEPFDKLFSPVIVPEQQGLPLLAVAPSAAGLRLPAAAAAAASSLHVLGKET